MRFFPGLGSSQQEETRGLPKSGPAFFRFTAAKGAFRFLRLKGFFPLPSVKTGKMDLKVAIIPLF